MLFPEQGIEIRDVLIKLVEKIQQEIRMDDYPQGYAAPMFIPDYVQAMQYGMRFMEKNGLEDLKKMRWYLDKLIGAYDKQSEIDLGDSGCGESSSVHGSGIQPCQSGQCNDGTQTSQVLG